VPSPEPLENPGRFRPGFRIRVQDLGSECFVLACTSVCHGVRSWRLDRVILRKYLGLRIETQIESERERGGFVARHGRETERESYELEGNGFAGFVCEIK
jgi:hypothetical protein